MGTRKDEISNASEITPRELMTEDLDAVSGGYRNNQTEAWHAFTRGIEAGLIMGGATVVCTP